MSRNKGITNQMDIIPTNTTIHQDIGKFENTERVLNANQDKIYVYFNRLVYSNQCVNIYYVLFLFSFITLLISLVNVFVEFIHRFFILPFHLSIVTFIFLDLASKSYIKVFNS
jgi:hypothetical protein